MKALILILGYCATSCEAQFQLFRNKNFTGEYFRSDGNITETCQNIPNNRDEWNITGYYSLQLPKPASIITQQCIVFFSLSNCNYYDTSSFKLERNSSDLQFALTLRGDTIPTVASYRACTANDKYAYVYDHYLVYAYASDGISDLTKASVKKIFIDPTCTTLTTSVYFYNVVALSPICVKLYTSYYCDGKDDILNSYNNYNYNYYNAYDYLNLNPKSITLQPWTAKAIVSFGSVRSIKPCNSEDMYKAAEKPKVLPKPDIPYTYSYDDQTYYTYSYSPKNYGSGGVSPVKLIFKLLFAIIGVALAVFGCMTRFKPQQQQQQTQLPPDEEANYYNATSAGSSSGSTAAEQNRNQPGIHPSSSPPFKPSTEKNNNTPDMVPLMQDEPPKYEQVMSSGSGGGVSGSGNVV